MAKRIKAKEKVRRPAPKILTDEETNRVFHAIYCTARVTETHCMRVLDWANRALFDSALVGTILDGDMHILVPDDPTLEFMFRNAQVPNVVPPGQHGAADGVGEAADATDDQRVVTALSATHELARLREEVRELRAELDVRQRTRISYFCMNAANRNGNKQ